MYVLFLFFFGGGREAFLMCFLLLFGVCFGQYMFFGLGRSKSRFLIREARDWNQHQAGKKIGIGQPQGRSSIPVT